MVVFSIIIVTYNSHDLIIEAISSVFEYAEKDNYEIIVVDNSDRKNHELLKNIIEEKFSNKIILLHNPKNGGYGQGNNIGIAHASGKYICIMNPDVRFCEPILNDAENKFLDNGKLALFSYKQIGGANISFYIKPEHKPVKGAALLTRFLNYISYFNSDRHYVSGAFFFVRKSVMEKIGGFDEKIFLYFEEPDVSNRILANNNTIEIDFSKKYIHLSHGRGFNEFAFKAEIESLNYYVKKFNLNRNTIFKNYLKEYKFNRIIFRLLGQHDRVEKTKAEIDIIQDTIKNTNSHETNN